MTGAGTIHVVGAGLAGLAAAVRLARNGRRVSVHDAAGHAGGRCRSFHDPTVGCVIDNGNHLLLSGNRAALAYLGEIGAAGTLTGPRRAAFAFFDLKTGERWTVRPNAGPLPWWIFAPSRRVPRSRARDYLAGLNLLRAGPDARVADCFARPSVGFTRFWEPLAVAVLNARADEGAAALLGSVVRETFARGESYCRPRIAASGLGASFVEPALRCLQGAGVPVHLGRRVRALRFAADRAIGLEFGDERIDIGDDDAVVLAVPPMAAAELVPELRCPAQSRAIVNVHFRRDSDFPEVALLGLIGGTAQWVVVRAGVASVTVSAADALLDEPAEAIAARVWPEVCRGLALADAPLPPYRVVKERRATFAQTPEQTRNRPGARTNWHNLVLAGDWTDTGLPATIEGAVRSGHVAAAVLLGRVPD